MHGLLRNVVCAALLALCANVAALPTTIDFESFADGLALSSEVPGLVFTNAVVLTAGTSLNELEFPPISGSKIASDSGGALAIDFATPIQFVEAYLTYSEQVTLQIFDAANNLVGSAISLHVSNYVSSGNTPNELLSASYAIGFTRAVFTGATGGSSYALDDLRFESAANGIPEPSTLALALLALAALTPRPMRRLMFCPNAMAGEQRATNCGSYCLEPQNP